MRRLHGFGQTHTFELTTPSLKAPATKDEQLPIHKEPTEDGQLSLTERVAVKARSQHKGKRGKCVDKPVAIELGGETVPVQRWNQVLLCLVNYILAAGQPLPSLPFIQLDKSSFKTSSARLTKLENGMYLEWGDSREGILRKVRRIMKAAGYRAHTVSVKLASGAIEHI